MNDLDAARDAGRREAERAGPLTDVAAIEAVAEILRGEEDAVPALTKEGGPRRSRRPSPTEYDHGRHSPGRG